MMTMHTHIAKILPTYIPQPRISRYQPKVVCVGGRKEALYIGFLVFSHTAIHPYIHTQTFRPSYIHTYIPKRNLATPPNTQQQPTSLQLSYLPTCIHTAKLSYIHTYIQQEPQHSRPACCATPTYIHTHSQPESLHRYRHTTYSQPSIYLHTYLPTAIHRKGKGCIERVRR